MPVGKTFGVAFEARAVPQALKMNRKHKDAMHRQAVVRKGTMLTESPSQAPKRGTHLRHISHSGSYSRESRITANSQTPPGRGFLRRSTHPEEDEIPISRRMYLEQRFCMLYAEW